MYTLIYLAIKFTSDTGASHHSIWICQGIGRFYFNQIDTNSQSIGSYLSNLVMIIKHAGKLYNACTIQKHLLVVSFIDRTLEILIIIIC